MREYMFDYNSHIWCFQSVFVMSAINYSELTYERPSEEYVYPDWAVGIGWALASCSAICIPIYAIYITCKFTIVEGKVSVKIRSRVWLVCKGLSSGYLK